MYPDGMRYHNGAVQEVIIREDSKSESTDAFPYAQGRFIRDGLVLADSVLDFSLFKDDAQKLDSANRLVS